MGRQLCAYANYKTFVGNFKMKHTYTYVITIKDLCAYIAFNSYALLIFYIFKVTFLFVSHVFNSLRFR